MLMIYRGETNLLDPYTLTLLVSASIFGCAYMIGKNHGEGNKDETIEDTIQSLIDNGFLRYTRNRSGELEILKLDE